jgi:hypothetical protein
MIALNCRGCFMIRRSLLLAPVLSITVIAGCGRPDDVVAPSASVRAAQAATVARLRPSYRDQLADLAREAPGFGGVFFDETGTLTIAVATDVFDSSSTQRVLDWVHRYSPATRAASRVKFQRVRYSYDVLHQQLQAIQSQLWNGDGVTAIGINERTGRIELSVQDQPRIATLRARMVQ